MISIRQVKLEKQKNINTILAFKPLLAITTIPKAHHCMKKIMPFI